MLPVALRHSRLPRLVTRTLRSTLQCPSSLRCFTVLGIESSADDTGVAIVTSNAKILANVVKKQHLVHENYGGIHPYVAVQTHQKNLARAVKEALEQANMRATDVDGIAFTRGPGMTGCLGVGSSAARTLAAALSKPLVGVHHMQAHALTPLLTSPPSSRPQFPFLTLLVSGGHTLLLLATSVSDFRILASTPDEAVGRVFDKVSRMLCLPWSKLGPGAALEEFCLDDVDGTAPAVEVPTLPGAMPSVLGFSFSGLHSAVERFVTANGGGEALDVPTKRALAREFQRAAVAQLEEKVQLGFDFCRRKGFEVRHVVVSGGVASNSYLRERLRIRMEQASPDVPIALVFPPPSLCTDNAAMIAWASMPRFLAGDFDDYSIAIRPKWSIEELSS
ncbi:peptidase M22, glycoprotease [Dentipellis sp. KUC8613]|nr:peptidase M22, glycoprotease [Dentipellis sp. KUC8613]